jgi:hypothetical protein
MNTDVVVGVSDRTTDALNHLFGSETGRRYLAERHGIDARLIAAFDDIGISGFANIVASIKLAKHLDYGPDDVIVTVATDSADLYATERAIYADRTYGRDFDQVNAGEVFGRCLEGLADDHVLELGHVEQTRIFNLGYFTWVEQQGVSVEDFDRRRSQSFWTRLVESIPEWDRLIDEFNAAVNDRAVRTASVGGARS